MRVGAWERRSDEDNGLCQDNVIPVKTGIQIPPYPDPTPGMGVTPVGADLCVCPGHPVSALATPCLPWPPRVCPGHPVSALATPCLPWPPRVCPGHPVSAPATPSRNRPFAGRLAQGRGDRLRIQRPFYGLAHGPQVRAGGPHPFRQLPHGNPLRLVYAFRQVG